MNKHIYYEENRNLEDEDIGYESPLYNVMIYDKHFLLTIGKERKLVSKKNHYYFPVYLMNQLLVQLQIGALEFESTKELPVDRMKPYVDSAGDVDLNRLGDIIFYSFADYDYFHAITIDVTPATISEMETKYIELASNEEKEEEKETTKEEAFELTENDIKQSKSIMHSEKVLKDGIFEQDPHIKRPMMLLEETKEQSLKNKKEYNERATAAWIEKYMKNNNYDIVETNDNGDCLFDTIRIAYEQIGYKTTIQKLRALVAKEATEGMFAHYRELYQLTLGEKDEIEKEMRRLVVVNKELKKRLKTVDPSEKEQRKKIITDANNISQQHKDLKEKMHENATLLNDFVFMKNVDSLEKLREYIQTPSFWADDWTISILEKELNMKLIIFSESSYNEDDKSNVLRCTSDLKDTEIFSPDFYIFTTYSGSHYRLITYKNKRVFKFSEIPYDIKIMVIIKCMEKNSGIFNKIQDFRNFKSKIGIENDESDEEQEEDTIVFYNKSNKLLKVGNGPNEKIGNPRNYSELNLKKHLDWRKKLDDEWTTNFSIDNMKWKTVEHYYQGAKFKKHNPHFYKLFSLDSDNDIGRDIDLALAAGSQKGSYKKGKTEIQLRPLDIKIDPDFYGPRKNEEREKALYAKFSQNEELKTILLATKDAVLKKHIPKAKAETDDLLMNVRKRLVME